MSEMKEKQKDCKTMGYKLVIGVMAVIIIILLWLLSTSKQLVTEANEQKEDIKIELTGELDSLMKEHQMVQKDYGELTNQMSQKDSIIAASAAEIKHLLAKTSDYNRIKRKLNILRRIQQSYVDQIDSLFTVNAKLKEEVVNYKTGLIQEKTKTSSLSKEKEHLTEIINNAASVINAYNITGKTYSLKGKYDREVETYKARRVERVKICFTLGKNKLAKPGAKTVYIRMSRPDKLIIAKGKGDAYSFEANGVKLQYSLKKEILYQNESMDICTTWDKRTDSAAMKGKYEVTIWMDGEQIGATSFTLE